MKKLFFTLSFMLCHMVMFAGPRLDSHDYHHHGGGGGAIGVIALIVLGFLFMMGGNSKR